MGVDYSSQFGIGVKIFFEEDFDYIEFLEERLKGSGFEYIEVGEAMYIGGINDFYILIKNPFENGLKGLENKCKELMEFLDKNKISFEGEIDVVGGLLVD